MILRLGADGERAALGMGLPLVRLCRAGMLPRSRPFASLCAAALLSTELAPEAARLVQIFVRTTSRSFCCSTHRRPSRLQCSIGYTERFDVCPCRGLLDAASIEVASACQTHKTVRYVLTDKEPHSLDRREGRNIDCPIRGKAALLGDLTWIRCPSGGPIRQVEKDPLRSRRPSRAVAPKRPNQHADQVALLRPQRRDNDERSAFIFDRSGPLKAFQADKRFDGRRVSKECRWCSEPHGIDLGNPESLHGEYNRCSIV